MIKVLFLAANPRDTKPLAIGSEYRDITQDNCPTLAAANSVDTLDAASQVFVQTILQVLIRT